MLLGPRKPSAHAPPPPSPPARSLSPDLERPLRSRDPGIRCGASAQKNGRGSACRHTHGAKGGPPSPRSPGTGRSRKIVAHWSRHANVLCGFRGQRRSFRRVCGSDGRRRCLGDRLGGGRNCMGPEARSCVSPACSPRPSSTAPASPPRSRPRLGALGGGPRRGCARCAVDQHGARRRASRIRRLPKSDDAKRSHFDDNPWVR